MLTKAITWQNTVLAHSRYMSKTHDCWSRYEQHLIRRNCWRFRWRWLVDEMKNLTAELKVREGIKPSASDVMYIAPQSAEMVALVIQIHELIDRYRIIRYFTKPPPPAHWPYCMHKSNTNTRVCLFEHPTTPYKFSNLKK